MLNGAPNSQGLLAPLSHWLRDSEVSEIMLNCPGEIIIEKQGRMQTIEVPVMTAERCRNLFQLIANENQQVIGDATPLLSGSLLDGSRIQLVLPPVSRYPTFAIRRRSIKHMSLVDYEQKDFYRSVKGASLASVSGDELSEQDRTLLRYYKAKQWGGFIRGAIIARKNIVISGGTSSGKTTFLNACLREIGEESRLLLLEDTREIDITHPNQVSLLAIKGEQGLARVTMQDLVQCSLRLRPDRLIMGEIRGKEILDFIAACATGHEGAMTTIHASSPAMAMMRMVQLYKLNNVPAMTDSDIRNELNHVIDVIIQLTKSPEGRRVSAIYYKHGHLNG
ncbi:MAG: P-type DNA transfer ATPase VirB11 [Legionellales bacterium]|nr:P-type DNA transfer ATPase VirB11 [Legionellales bacterium]|tara:strand:+ start:15306 stop:16313 length:1008 start_codon:yes stop_codon:yes gene_type:complete